MEENNELYQIHGDHIDGIMNSAEFVTKLTAIIERSTLYTKAETEVVLEDKPYKANVFSLVYGSGPMRMLALIVPSEDNKTNQFVSTYPMLEGKKVGVAIQKVVEWDNKIEATVYCSYGGFEFAFFATDYFMNKQKYVAGNVLDVELAALGMKVEEARRSFSFEGQQAIDWLTKNGQKPEYDSEGNVLPVEFNLESLVAYFNLDKKAPDEAEFQSPCGAIRTACLLDVDFFCTDITVHRADDESEVSLSDLIVPLYFRQDFFPKVKEGDPVSGWLWLTGRVR